MGQLIITLSISQRGSNLDGTVLDSMLTWIKTNIDNNIPAPPPGGTISEAKSPSISLYPLYNQAVQVGVAITVSNVTLSGTLINQLNQWVSANVTSKLPNSYTLDIGVSTTL
jgi:hypothetical protein